MYVTAEQTNFIEKLYLKKYKKIKKYLAKSGIPMYTNKCCGMIAVKREVAGSQQ